MKVLLVGIVLALSPPTTPVEARTTRQRVHHQVHRHWTTTHHAHDAMAVLLCESGGNPRAENGQYLGLFQMGEYERNSTNWGWAIRKQARAAKLYWVRTGRDWDAWACQP